jgi:imidazolonepropionase-like amidohydrolase
MNKTLRTIILAAALPALITPCAPAGAPAQKKFILQGGTLINGVIERPLKDHLVVVEGGRITGVGRKNRLIIPQDAEVIDVTGKFIMPGLVDAHVHEDSKADWPRYLAWGVTSVNCMYENSDTALERESWSQRDSVRAPRIFAAAPVFTTKGGWWEGDAFPVDPAVDRFPATPDEARAAVRALNAKGIRRIKLMVDDMGWCRDPLPRLRKMDPAVMNALLDEAKKLRMLAEVHSPMLADATAAIAAGAPVLVHGIVDERVDAPLVEAILSGDGFYIPTFSLYRFLAGPGAFMAQAFSDPRFRSSLSAETVDSLTGPEYAARYRERYPNGDYVKSRLTVLDDNFSSLLGNYAQVAMGTDMWALPGIGAHLELESMVKAGMTPMQALTSATFLSAKAVRIFAKTGTIEPGKDADLLILDADPLTDIRNTRSISMVVRMGRIYRPAELIGAAGQ